MSLVASNLPLEGGGRTAKRSGWGQMFRARRNAVWRTPTPPRSAFGRSTLPLQGEGNFRRVSPFEALSHKASPNHLTFRLDRIIFRLAAA
jgi:hypothetical protein